MKWWPFNDPSMKFLYPYHLLLMVWFLPTWCQAQDSHTTNTNRPWYYPDHVVLQFAGNIGLLAAGPGYSFARDKMDAELLYGYAPGFEASTGVHIITAKWSYRPFRINLKKGYLLEPLKMGTGISYSVGPQFHTTWPGRYPDGYYWWTSSFRLTPFFGPTINRKVGHEHTLIKRIQLYAEVGTNDLALVSFIGNKKLGFTEILNIALGTRLVL
jgi:hypothetical protein